MGKSLLLMVLMAFPVGMRVDPLPLWQHSYLRVSPPRP